MLNLAFGAIGAGGALIAYWMIDHRAGRAGSRTSPASLRRGRQPRLRAAVRPRLRGTGPPCQDDGDARPRPDPCSGSWAGGPPPGARSPASCPLPSSTHTFTLFGAFVNWTQVIALAFAVVLTLVTTLFLRYTNLGTAYRAIANDREIAATSAPRPPRRGLGVVRLGARRRRRGPAAAGPDPSLDYAALTFLVIAALAAALIGRLQSLWATSRAASRSGSRRRSSRRTPRWRATARPRRSCSRSSRCSGSHAAASSTITRTAR